MRNISDESDEKPIHQAMEQPLPFTTQDYLDEMSSPSEASIQLIILILSMSDLSWGMKELIWRMEELSWRMERLS